MAASEKRLTDPTRVSTSFTDRQGQRREVILEYGAVRDRVEVLAISIRGGYVDPVTRQVIEDLPFTKLVDAHRPSWASLMRDVADHMPTRTLREAAHRELDQHKDKHPRSAGRPPLSDDQLQLVAQVYMEAWRDHSRTPTKAVREKLNLEPSQAANRVHPP